MSYCTGCHKDKPTENLMWKWTGILWLTKYVCNECKDNGLKDGTLHTEQHKWLSQQGDSKYQ